MVAINGPTHVTEVLIAGVQSHSLNTHAQLASRARGQKFRLSLQLLPFNVHASSEGSDEPVHMRRLV